MLPKNHGFQSTAVQCISAGERCDQGERHLNFYTKVNDHMLKTFLNLRESKKVSCLPVLSHDKAIGNTVVEMQFPPKTSLKVAEWFKTHLSQSCESMLVVGQINVVLCPLETDTYSFLIFRIINLLRFVQHS